MQTVSRDRRLRAGLAGLAALLLAVTACGGGASSSGGGQAATSAGARDPNAFTVLSNAENTTVPGELKKLAVGACATENKALPLQVQTVPQTSLDQKLQLLAGQKALPAMLAAGNAPATTKALVKAGEIADLQTELTQLVRLNYLTPPAPSTLHL